VAKTQFNVAGITFRIKDMPALAHMYPRGPVVITPEPDNKYDAKALKVLWGEVHIGYVPKGPYQDELHQLIANGTEYCAEIAKCGWREGEDWNNDGTGELSSITVTLSCDGDHDWFVNDGKPFIRITALLQHYAQGGREHLDRWMCQFGSYEAYEAELNRLADAGTKMHTAIEAFLKSGVATPGLPPQFRAFLAGEKGLNPLSMENRIWDNLIGVCGKYDLFAETQQGRIVYDWKSSKTIHFSKKLQACFYGKHKGADFVKVVAFGAKNKRGYALWTGDKAAIERGYKAVVYLAELENISL
jgi:hypothetical protein